MPYNEQKPEAVTPAEPAWQSAEPVCPVCQSAEPVWQSAEPDDLAEIVPSIALFTAAALSGLLAARGISFKPDDEHDMESIRRAIRIGELAMAEWYRPKPSAEVAAEPAGAAASAPPEAKEGEL